MTRKTHLAALAAAALLCACAALSPSGWSGAKLYQMGRYDEALAVWTREAKQGDPVAAYRLGREYLDGKEGVTARNLPGAVALLKQAAQGGEARAQMDLASLYDAGLGVERDLKRAAEWYLAAARQGLPDAQHNIATMYETGEGLEKKDLPRAYMFYRLSIRNGFTHFAQPKLDALAKRMTPGQIARGTLLLSVFRPSGPAAAKTARP